MVWLAALLLPPVGLVWLWFQKGRSIPAKFGGSVLVLVWSLVWLGMLFLLMKPLGLRFQLDGSGMVPRFFSFKGPEASYAELEKNRAQQATVKPPETGSRASVPPAATASVTPPAPVATEPTSRPAPRLAPSWPGFRGPHRDGVYTETPILTSWRPEGLPLLWRQPVGGGYASFAIAQGRAYTIEQRREQEVVAAYDLRDGRELWTNAWKAEFKEAMGGDGPRATPQWHDGRLYALGATGEFRCLDAADGRTIWRKNILEDNAAENLQWGMSAAPLIVDDKVIVLPGGRGSKSVVAYDRSNGAPVWRALDDKAAYTAPMVAALAGKRQLVVVTGTRAAGLTVEDGKLLWEYPWTTEYDINSAQPIVVGPNRLFLSAGYGHGAAVIEIGDAGAKTLWSNMRMKNKFTSSVLYEGHIYGLDEAILACVNAETGDLKWKGGRYGYGQLVLASGHLVVTTETGEVVLVKATPDGHQEVARFSAISGKTWNHPAIAGGVLLVRNATEMAGFRIAP